MRKILSFTLLVLSVLTISGCGNQVKVSDKVTFPDGTPLTTGKILFENDQPTYSASIRSDGTFSMGMLKDGEGIPTGEYRVAVFAIVPGDEDKIEEPPRLMTHSKYASSRTSEITCNVQKKTNVPIVVEGP